MARMTWMLFLGLLVVGPVSPTSADDLLVDRLKKTIKDLREANKVLQDANDELLKQSTMIQEMHADLSAQHAKLMERYADRERLRRQHREIVSGLDKMDELHRARIKALETGQRLERASIVTLLASLGSPAVLPMARALETAPAAYAPVICPALEKLGAAARPAVPALKRVRENTEGEPSHLAGRALLTIRQAKTPIEPFPDKK